MHLLYVGPSQYNQETIINLDQVIDVVVTDPAQPAITVTFGVLREGMPYRIHLVGAPARDVWGWLMARAESVTDGR